MASDRTDSDSPGEGRAPTQERSESDGGEGPRRPPRSRARSGQDPGSSGNGTRTAVDADRSRSSEGAEKSRRSEKSKGSSSGGSSAKRSSTKGTSSKGSSSKGTRERTEPRSGGPKAAPARRTAAPADDTGTLAEGAASRTSRPTSSDDPTLVGEIPHAPAPSVVAPTPAATAPAPDTERRRRRSSRGEKLPPGVEKAGRRRGRRVHRVLRRIDLWSVLKLSIVLYTCLYVAVLGTFVLLWGVLYSSGQIERLQSFLADIGMHDFRFYGDQMFRALAALGAIGVLAGTVITVLTAALVNVISETTGGIRLVVIEEEPPRRRGAAPGEPARSGPRRPPVP